MKGSEDVAKEVEAIVDAALKSIKAGIAKQGLRGEIAITVTLHDHVHVGVAWNLEETQPSQ